MLNLEQTFDSYLIDDSSEDKKHVNKSVLIKEVLNLRIITTV